MNMNILFMFVFTTYSNQTSMCRFRFGPKTPEHEPNRTVASLTRYLYSLGINNEREKEKKETYTAAEQVSIVNIIFSRGGRCHW